jgi:hypothetical protein
MIALTQERFSFGIAPLKIYILGLTKDITPAISLQLDGLLRTKRTCVRFSP